jgi:hypothetical protein
MIQLAFAQKISVIGVVIDEKNKQPIDGAIINLNNEYVITKDDGVFNFSKIDAQEFVLKVSSIGYESYQQNFSLKTIAKTITIQLKEKI